MKDTTLNSLNEAQRLAVTAPLGYQLILAGAGSGKTRVLVHRIAWLIQSENISLNDIFAVTFTNKAAHEMRTRLEELLGISTRTLWLGTFHGLAHRLLRLHWQEAGLPQEFQIMDADDQSRFIRRVMTTLNLDEERFPPKQAQWFINGKKDAGLGPHQIAADDISKRTWIKIYSAYQDACQRAGLIDFADLLLKIVQLWQSRPDILTQYQERFRCILVDEFQDTNAIQYACIRLLAGQHNYVTIVGDDDQSIYGWRGAEAENLHRFCQDFPSANTIRLEQNYRSSGKILKAANALIQHNRGRMGKNLWTSGDDGDPITVYSAFNDLDEVRFVAHEIHQLKKTGIRFSDIAILYRSNAQSRLLEEALIQRGISYIVYGGLRFFERAEIKDALAYLRLVANRHDDMAFERVVNTPVRGIGDRTIESIREKARENTISYWSATESLLTQNIFAARATQSLKNFLLTIHSFSEDTENLPLYEQVEHIVHHSGLIQHVQKEKGEKGLMRLENLEELVNAARQFHLENTDDTMTPLMAFLSYAALESGEKTSGLSEDNVQLMTLHAAKGLEFPVVFLCGCEENLFPHHLSQEDPNKLEEERRLCYVGMTRAMKKLYLTYAEIRRLHGKETRNRPSRFLREIPTELYEKGGLKTKIASAIPLASHFTSGKQNENNVRIGQTVTHHQFGEGIVLQCEGHGENSRIQVRFAKAGTKWLIASFVKA